MPPETRRGYDRVLTHLPNVVVRVAVGSELGLTPQFLPVLLKDVRDYHGVQRQAKDAEGARESLRAKIVQTLWELPQLRGIEEEDQKRVLDFIPEHEVKWNLPLLRKSLGSLAGLVVKDEPFIDLSIPPSGLPTQRGTILTVIEIRQTFVQSLMQKGVSREDALQVVQVKRKSTIDEEALRRLEREKHIQIPPEVRSESIVNWRLTPYPLR